jgi:hypothetical protein
MGLDDFRVKPSAFHRAALKAEAYKKPDLFQRPSRAVMPLPKDVPLKVSRGLISRGLKGSLVGAIAGDLITPREANAGEDEDMKRYRRGLKK